VLGPWMLGWVACGGDDGKQADDTPAPSDTGSPTDSEEPTDSETTDTEVPPTETGGPTDTGEPPACPEDPALSVVSAAVSDGLLPNQRAVTVTLSSPAAAAVRCVKVGDPAELHLLESAVPATQHTLHFSGLLPDSDYSCEAVATCPTSAGAGVVVPMTTAPGPGNLPTVEVTVDPALGMTGAWTLLPFRDGACDFAGRTWLVAYDPEGVPRWWQQLPEGVFFDVEALYHADVDSVVWGGGAHTDGRTNVWSLTTGTTYASGNLPQVARGVFHHDGKLLDDGRILTLQNDDNTGRGRAWTGWRVRAHDPATGAVSVDLQSQRYVDEGWLRVSTGVLDEDPYHANWMDLIPHATGERAYVSQCFDQSILSLDAATGDVRWKLQQDDGWTVVDPAGNELPQSMLPECQHGIEVIGDDVLLVYDNGQNRRESQITELTVDAVNRRVTVEWQWTDGWFEDTLGDVDDLGNGRVLVTQAHPECWSPSRGARSRILEVDRATGQVASEVAFRSAQHTTYRSQRYEGCEFLPGTRFCATVLTRAGELAPLFDR